MLISGTVIKSLGMGKKLGFPTLNLNPKKVPKFLRRGIYAVYVRADGRTFKGVLHYGLRPTHGLPVSFEVHCIGLKKNLYGRRISIIIKKRLRSVKNFVNESALKKRIKLDEASAKAYFLLQNANFG